MVRRRHMFALTCFQRLTLSKDSDILHIRLLSTHVFILNSAKATKDLLDRRSTIYSDRSVTKHIVT